MIQITIHGRGGQGAVRASQLLAEAAFLQGYHVQAFPFFGVERGGAPVEAFVRLDDKEIITREQIEKADYAIVFDTSLIDRVNASKTFVNSSHEIDKTEFFDASGLAMQIFPQAVNTAMIAFFSCRTGIVEQKSLIEACKKLFSENSLKNNLKIIYNVFEKCMKKKR